MTPTARQAEPATHDAERPRLALVVGSVREGRRAPAVASWVAERAATVFDVETVDLVDLDLPVDLSGGGDTDRFAAVIAAADAVLVVTSEYNHGYPAALKTAFDTLKYEWRSKPVGFVAYGGLAGGARAIEQLRQVVVEVHMVPVRECVLIPRIKHAFRDGSLDTSTDANAAASDGLDRLLRQLDWWARTVRDAPTSYPG